MTNSASHVASADLEREIQAKASNGPRVTPADIEAEIVAEHYFTAAQGVDGADIEQLRAQDQAAPLTLQPMTDDPQPWRTSVIGPLSLLTFCVLILRNGFTVTGESACASPENFNADIGRRIARENAVNKVWPLLGFRLRDKLRAEDFPLPAQACDLSGEGACEACQ